MKKLISIIMMVILLSIYGCTGITENNSETNDTSNKQTVIDPPENPTVLIGSGFQSGGGDSIGENCEVEFKPTNNDEKKIGTSKEIEIEGQKIKGKYSSTLTAASFKGEIIYYSEDQYPYDTFMIDGKTGKILGFSNYENVKKASEYIKKEETSINIINIDEAETIAKDLIIRLTGINNWETKIKHNGNKIYYSFVFYIYESGVRLIQAGCNISILGGIVDCAITSPEGLEDAVIPDWEDQVYIDGAKTRLDEYYKDKNVKEIKDYEVEYKWLRYLKDHDSDAIEYVLHYTVVYEDGTEKETGNQFYYLY